MSALLEIGLFGPLSVQVGGEPMPRLKTRNAKTFDTEWYAGVSAQVETAISTAPETITESETYARRAETNTL